MKPVSAEQAKHLVRLHNELCTLYHQRDAMALNYMSHPEASANRIMEICAEIGESRQEMRERTSIVTKVVEKHRYTASLLNSYI